MKKYILLCAILSAMMIITPLMSVEYNSDVKTDNKKSDRYIDVMKKSTGEIEKTEMREYIIGCVAGEMDARYHEEALKAQAVASYTFAEYIKNRNNDKDGADITDSSSEHQAYIDKEKRKEKWKDDFEKNESAVEKAVDAVLGEYISYNGEPIMAVFFDKCGGMTESSENIWGKKLPYLISVTSDGDTLAPDIDSVSEYTYEEFKKSFAAEGVDFSSSESIIGKTDRFDSGVVKTVETCGREISGTEFREILDLKSADFTVEETEDVIKITCRGSGHFVGMSQYGADYMARQGSSYREILSHYYPNTEIT